MKPVKRVVGKGGVIALVKCAGIAGLNRYSVVRIARI